jgi:hypothetical protein
MDKLAFDDWGAHCPVCKMIVEHEDWPRAIECGEIDSDEVRRGEAHPPCMLCGSHELKEQWLTVPTNDMNAMTHTRLVTCESCGSGRSYGGIDAITGQPSIVFNHPNDLDHMELREQMQRHIEQGEENEELLQKVKFAIALDAFFRPLQFYCLDEGWNALGYGVRPLDRTEIMTRFYEWTNREAMSEATEADNPLRRNPAPAAKKRRWW